MARGFGGAPLARLFVLDFLTPLRFDVFIPTLHMCCMFTIVYAIYSVAYTLCPVQSLIYNKTKASPYRGDALDFSTAAAYNLYE